METPGDVIVYEIEDGLDAVQLRVVNATVWLNQRQISQLFCVSQDNVGLHLKNICEGGELGREATTEESSVVQMEGGREVRRPLNRLFVIFLETAELRAKTRTETRMGFWRENVDQIITSNGFPLLDHAGKISNEQMEQHAAGLYLEFDQRRKAQEASEADARDAADLKALEAKLKRRPKQSKNPPA